MRRALGRSTLISSPTELAELELK